MPTTLEVEALIAIEPFLIEFRALERLHEDRSQPTMALVVDTIERVALLCAQSERDAKVKFAREYFAKFAEILLEYVTKYGKFAQRM